MGPGMCSPLVLPFMEKGKASEVQRGLSLSSHASLHLRQAAALTSSILTAKALEWQRDQKGVEDPRLTIDSMLMVMWMVQFPDPYIHLGSPSRSRPRLKGNTNHPVHRGGQAPRSNHN
jgi:hypothetical protein